MSGTLAATSAGPTVLAGQCALGGLFSRVDAGGRQGLAPFVFVVPLTAVFGLVQVLRPATSGLREVEASGSVDVAKVAAGVALAIMRFDGVLAAVATLAR